MKNIKKILSCIGAFVLAFGIGASFASCGEKPDKKPAGKTHDPVTLQVTGKDAVEPHNYVDGKCKMCDTTTIFSQDPIGGTAAMAECDQKGSVVEIKYNTHSYYLEKEYPDAGDLVLEKTAYVYLPYGYNAEDKGTKYNVLYLLHGHGLNEGYWFKRGSFVKEDNTYTLGYGTEAVLDNLIKSGKAEKTIVVTPTFYSEVEGYESKDNNDIIGCFGYELQNDLMPYIAENYNTYAKDGSKESLKEARDHQAYAGLSMGSCLSYNTIWNYCLEYFSYIGSYSAGATMDVQEIVNNVNTNYANCPVKYYYACCGTMEMGGENNLDGMLGTYLAIQNGVKGMKPGCNVKAGENCTFMLCNKTAHNYATWITALYNSMQVFFKA